MKTAIQVFAAMAFVVTISSCASEERSSDRYTGFTPEANNSQMLESDHVYSTIPTPPNKRNILRNSSRASSNMTSADMWNSNY